MTISYNNGSGALTYDQTKFLAAQLIKRSSLRLVCKSVCDPVKMPDGNGLTAYFVRYNRMNVPLATLTEGTPPSASDFTLSQVTVTLEQWGDLIKITDLAEITAKHPVVQQAMKLLADNAARVIDREIQLVWLANTNVQYGDGTHTTRDTLANNDTGDFITDAAIHKAVADMVDDGVTGRDGPAKEDAKEAGATGTVAGGNAFVAICGPQILRDIMSQQSSTLGTFIAVAMYANQKALYNVEVGTWLGVRWVETNFIPKFSMLGAVNSGALTSGTSFGTNTPTVTFTDATGGTVTGVKHYFKVTRTSKLRGFEEEISDIQEIDTPVDSSNDKTLSFAFPGSASDPYLYKLYVGVGSASDSVLRAVSNSGHAPGSTVTITAPVAQFASNNLPPENVKTATDVVHPVWLLGAEACSLVTLRNLEFKTVSQPDHSNPLGQYKQMGYKFLHKAVVLDSTRLKRLEFLSHY